MKTIKVGKNQRKEIVIERPGKYLVELVGEGAEVEISGSFKVGGETKHEVELLIHHKAAHTRANTVLKAVAKNQSFIRFVGRIIIDKKCPDTQSFLEERVLLLSDEARAETIPDLEIESDDVKCSHAASISTLDETQIFYLMSRGLPREAAKKMIVEGFLWTNLINQV